MSAIAVRAPAVTRGYRWRRRKPRSPALLARARRNGACAPMPARHVQPAAHTLLLPCDVLRCHPGRTEADPHFRHRWPGTGHLYPRDHSYRVSLVVAFAAIGLALLIGVPIGVIAGYIGGPVDFVISRVLDILLSFPAILLAISLIAILGQGEQVMIVAIAIVYVPILTRVLRASVMDVKSMAFVEGARARGAGQIRIMVRHVLPNSIGPTLVQAALLGAFAIQVEAALSYLGLGIEPPTPSLGYMLQENSQYITQSPWGMLFPCIGIAIAVLAFNLAGAGLRDLLDPRGRDR